MFYRRDCGRNKSREVELELSKLRQLGVSSVDDGGLAILWLRDRRFFELQAERVTYDSVAFRYIVVNTHLDNDTIASFHGRVESCIYVDTGDGASDGTAEVWDNQSGWHKGEGKQAQGDKLWICTTP